MAYVVLETSNPSDSEAAFRLNYNFTGSDFATTTLISMPLQVESLSSKEIYPGSVAEGWVGGAIKKSDDHAYLRLWDADSESHGTGYAWFDVSKSSD